MAGLAAGGAEAAMPMVANWLYGETDTSKLNAEQKQTISNIVGLGAAGFTASAGGTTTDIAQSALSSQSAVENNILNAVDVSRYLQIALDSHANKGTDMRDRIQALVDKSAENDAMLKVIQKKLDNYRVNGVNTLTPEDYTYLERVEKNFGGKKGMEQTYYAVVQAAKIAVSQGKLTSDDYKNLVNQMYQFNMANPMIGQIDDILTEATVAQKNPSGFTPKVEQPLVVQTKGYDLNSATKQAGIKDYNEPIPDADKIRIANGAAVISKIAGTTADNAIGVAGICALSSNPFGEACAAGMTATAAGAALVDYGARGVEQLARPNLGQTVVDGFKDVAVDAVGKTPVVGPVLVPATSAGIDILKDSQYGKSVEDFINK